MRSAGRRAGRAAAVLLAVLALLAAALAALLLGSRPALDGRIGLPGLHAPAAISRDALGVVAIEAGDRLDLARAAGFAHAQERFLSMDFQRRWAGGELAALLGAAALPQDRRVRLHRFRARAERLLGELAPAERALLEAYAAGVNRGLAALAAPAFPYPLLLARPAPWRPEDSLLALFSMHLALQGGRWRYEAARGALAREFGPAAADFLAPVDSALAAPLDGSPTPHAAPLPGPAAIDLRHVPLDPARLPEVRMPWEQRAGSNAFAVGGALTAHGAGLLANDMHLVLTVPNIWFRMHWRWREDGRERELGGVTLPGMPWMIAGSNGAIAWGFTNGNIDSQDLRPPAPGAAPARVDAERLEVRFGADETLAVAADDWGPLLGPDGGGRALRWTSHLLEGRHINFRRIERAADVGEALGLFQRSGIPGQNVLLVDRAGDAAWTLAGPLLRRGGRSGRLPAAAGTPPPGLLPAADYPAVRNPPDHRLWSANSRHVGGAAFARLGDGRYAYAARARRIRDRLRERERFAEADLLDIQLDRRADHLRPWLRRLERVLDHPRTAAAAARLGLRAHLAAWDGRSAADSVAYRALRTFRKRCHERFLLVLQTRLGGRPDARMRELRWQLDAPLDRILAADARHFLPQGMRDWDEFLARALAQVLEELEAGRDGGREERIGHLLTRALPFLGPWLDAPPDPLPGDLDVVRVERGDFGASERMAVAPGREEQGLLHMPGGQSGHPLSPFYLAGHADWVAGRPSPFLPGPERHRLRLAPSEH